MLGSVTMVNDKLMRVGTRNWHESVDGISLRHGLRYFILLLLVCTLSSVVHCNNINTDATALLLFKQYADPNNVHLQSWKDPGGGIPLNPCTRSSWVGVTCSQMPPRVVKVDVSSRQLSGTFNASTLINLSELKLLNVSQNTFQASALDDLGNFANLEQLLADHAQLSSSSFPNSLASNVKLQTMILAGNSLSGTVPDLSGQTAMQSLDLSSNGFWGSLPALPVGVKDVTFRNNNFNGTIPPNYTVPNTVTSLDLSNNQLSGAVPASVENAPNVLLTGNAQLCGLPGANSKPCTKDATQPAPPPTPSLTPPAEEHHKRHYSAKAIIVIVVVNVVGLLLIGGGLLMFFIKPLMMLKSKFMPPNGAAPLPTSEADPIKPPPQAAEDPPAGTGKSGGTGGGAIPEGEKTDLIFVDESSHKFELDELLRASAEILGKGSLGTTYKARLDNGQTVAVKRLKDVKEMPKKEFEKKMNALGRMNHPHLLPLRAYYYTKEEKLLVYDYMYNGSLASVLHGPKDAGTGQSARESALPWDARLHIAFDVALGLKFLHEKYSPRTSPHHNLKSTNVILGPDYEAYLADFCLVPLMPARIAAQGMTGYPAPEYNRTKKRSEKADIYSYGVLLLELLTGRKPALASDPDAKDLPKFVKAAVREEWTAEVFDLQMKTSRNGDAEMVTVLQIAMRCVEEDPEQRPSLDQVLKVFENMLQSKGSYQDQSPSEELSSIQYDSRDVSREMEPDHDSASFSR